MLLIVVPQAEVLLEKRLRTPLEMRSRVSECCLHLAAAYPCRLNPLSESFIGGVPDAAAVLVTERSGCLARGAPCRRRGALDARGLLVHTSTGHLSTPA